MLYIFIIIEVGIIVGVVGPCFARAILLDFSEKPLGPSSLSVQDLVSEETHGPERHRQASWLGRSHVSRNLREKVEIGTN